MLAARWQRCPTETVAKCTWAPARARATLDWNLAAPMTAPSSLLLPDPTGSITLNFPGLPGQAYSVQATTNLANPVWVNLGSAQASTMGRSPGSPAASWAPLVNATGLVHAVSP